ncbi:hypothetical protein AXG93_2675s1400 [Marchantia polymorpha subsp. ruderalis]|uniref:Uncharacterized protein n=1 Tax=Marchantia polymorpha subsp. ruderalis TaxID=1480154 RepID=A0A176VS72_MARPO|nr:hypothetical protein AXG93_2675s1400 [Marchantia polymorpha subsp. ruderalis]
MGGEGSQYNMHVFVDAAHTNLAERECTTRDFSLFHRSPPEGDAVDGMEENPEPKLELALSEEAIDLLWGWRMCVSRAPDAVRRFVVSVLASLSPLQSSVSSLCPVRPERELAAFFPAEIESCGQLDFFFPKLEPIGQAKGSKPSERRYLLRLIFLKGRFALETFEPNRDVKSTLDMAMSAGRVAKT